MTGDWPRLAGLGSEGPALGLVGGWLQRFWGSLGGKGVREHGA